MVCHRSFWFRALVLHYAMRSANVLWRKLKSLTKAQRWLCDLAPLASIWPQRATIGWPLNLQNLLPTVLTEPLVVVYFEHGLRHKYATRKSMVMSMRT